MPSLNIKKLKFSSKLKNIRGISRKFILFNASVVPRKNLHLLINIFQSSEIGSKGFDLCVAGKIHDDKYGLDIKRMCESDSRIKLLDYVDETEKAWLLLNAHAFASPSCVEGFGIPVLDAASLGVRVLASDLPSHREIANLVKENRNFRLLDLSNVDKWINEFNQLSTLDLCMEDEIKDRISNFRICFENLKDIFDRSIVDLVT
jgi:glycosyltransferase involved in cell wall biosynthesis